MLYTKVRFFVTNTLPLCEKSEKYFIVFSPHFSLKSLLVVVKKKKGWALFVSYSFNVLTPLKFNVNVFASSFHLLIFVLY